MTTMLVAAGNAPLESNPVERRHVSLSRAVSIVCCQGTPDSSLLTILPALSILPHRLEQKKQQNPESRDVGAKSKKPRDGRLWAC